MNSHRARDLGIKSKEIRETSCSQWILGGDKATWMSICRTAKLLQSPVVLYNSFYQKLCHLSSFLQSLISTYFLFPVVSVSLFFMFRIFHKSFIISLPFMCKTLLKPWGKHIRWQGLSLQSCEKSPQR